ncbi:relaxase/mobilization nuclease domain-containing protein [Streptomyces fenghuangensis]
MIPKIRRGSRTYGLLAYLYGPGRRDEHTDPHLVASWDGFAPDPGRDPEATLPGLARALDLRVVQAGDRAPVQHVWHCSVRTAPGDRHLSDAEWGEVAGRLVRATGLAPEGDPDGCRWVAVRHADDHIHIVATMVRGDLRRPRMSYDFKRAQAECRRIEKEWGLRRLNPGDGTGAKNPTSAERFKAERTGRDRTPRETLREAVRRAVAGAATEEEFFTRLHEAGLRVNKRLAPSGDVLGYSVALPGDRNRDGEPIWFSGSKLAPDLSLPRIRRRLEAAPLRAEADGRPRKVETEATTPHRPCPAQARRDAVQAAEHAADVLGANDDAGAAQLVGIGELLDGLAQTAPPTTRRELAEAARAFERATRSHVRAEQADHRALRSAARGIIRAGSALGRGEDGGATAMLLSTLVLVAIAAARWHSARHHAQQAAASREAAAHLRVAYENAAHAPMKALREQGRNLPAPVREDHAARIRAALPDRAARMSGEPGWDALLATLDQAERAGHDSAALLERAVGMRELATAENANHVLVWRLRRLAGLPAHPNPPRRNRAAGSHTSRPRSEHSASIRRTPPVQPIPASSSHRPPRR